MIEVKEFLQFVNVLIIPLLYYLHRIDTRLTKLETEFRTIIDYEKRLKKIIERE